MKNELCNLFFIFFILLSSAGAFISCASKDVMKYEKIDEFEINEEFEEMVKVQEIKEEKKVDSSPILKDQIGEKLKSEAAKFEGEAKSSGKKEVNAEEKPPGKKSPLTSKVANKKANKTNSKKEVGEKKVVVKSKREPDLEDKEGFIGRRPVVDPFRVGEKVKMAVTYFNMAAGYLIFEVKPFIEVNGKKSYHFQISVNSSKVFSYFYAVEDVAETFVDYDSLVPSTYKIKVKESKQLKDVRSFFDFKNLSATYWQKRVTQDKGEESKKIEWDIKAYSQNVISALFYLRTFKLDTDKSLAFRVANQGENIIFTGKVVRKEKLSTPLGDLDTVVVQPKIQVGGAFKQVGDISIWLTDDDRKFPVRIDSKIKIGTLVSKIVSIDP